MYKNGKLFVNGFPPRITEKNRGKLSAFENAINQARLLDPDHPDVIASLALIARIHGHHDTEYNLMQRLLWDQRVYAFDLGQQILDQRLGHGATYYTDNLFAGLPGYVNQAQAVNELTEKLWFKEDRGK